MDAVVDGVQALVNLPFILMLKDFVLESIKPLTSTGKKAPIEGLDVEDAGPGVSPATSSAKSEESRSPGELSPKSEKETDIIEGSEEDTDSVRNVTIQCKVKNPLVALVEDAKDKDSRALVLNVRFVYSSTGFFLIGH